MSRVNQMIMAAGGIRPSKAVYSCIGADQSYVVPWGVTSVLVKMWGAAGASQYGIGHGGGAAYVTGLLAVTPGETITVMVGRGGQYHGTAGNYGGGGLYGGGGRSALLRAGIEICTAGAGGGGAANYSNVPGDYPYGGAGGLASGQDGGTSVSGAVGGKGGSQSAGGDGGTGAAPGVAGALHAGGTGYTGSGGPGGGGSGYWGGGSGANGSPNSSGIGGGGGGSSYLGLLTSTGSSAGGINNLPGGQSDPDYLAGIGLGPAYGTSGPGGDGRVVIIPQ